MPPDLAAAGESGAEGTRRRNSDLGHPSSGAGAQQNSSNAIAAERLGAVHSSSSNAAGASAEQGILPHITNSSSRKRPQPPQQQQQQQPLDPGTNSNTASEEAAAAAAAAEAVAHPLRFLSKIIESIQATDRERYFIFPVDERGAPKYYSIIKSPMSFSVMQQKLDAGAYTSWRAFVADFELIVTNARTYNTNKTRCYKCAQTLQRNINRILGQHELDIRKAFTALFPLTPGPGGGGAAVITHGVGAAGSRELGWGQPETTSKRSTPQEAGQPVTLSTSCGLQLTVPSSTPPPLPTAAAREQQQQQLQVLMPPPARRVPICDHISDDEDLTGGGVAQQHQQYQQQQGQQQQGHVQGGGEASGLVPLETLLVQLRMAALRQPWATERASPGVAPSLSSPPAEPTASHQQQHDQQQQGSNSGLSQAWKDARRPIEWQCHWLELRRRELLAQQHRLEVRLRSLRLHIDTCGRAHVQISRCTLLRT